MSRALANELAAASIRVNTVHPTGVATGHVTGLEFKVDAGVTAR